MQSTKLLQEFDERPLALELSKEISRKAKSWHGKHPIRITSLAPLDIQGDINLHETDKIEVINNDWGSNSYLIGLAFVKAIKLLIKNGEIELVSLTKTKLTRGFIHKDTGVPFKIVLHGKVEENAGKYLTPKIYMKHGEWKNN